MSYKTYYQDPLKHGLVIAFKHVAVTAPLANGKLEVYLQGTEKPVIIDCLRDFLDKFLDYLERSPAPMFSNMSNCGQSIFFGGM
ncbi:MAG: hypothetical protein LBS45_10365 [Synergistaceae bacterium]|jgi:hypothetical protein|nr:hypothetical protein [Synergistaceae bacterium]